MGGAPQISEPNNEPQLSIPADRKLGAGAPGTVFLCRYNGGDAVIKVSHANTEDCLREARPLLQL